MDNAFAFTPMRPCVEVVAAVILSHDRRRFLLACRPEAKAYAGYWEFPGGKIESGETQRAALDRELLEELGIRVTLASPWISREFCYPHAQVHIHFWRVLSWEGDIDLSLPVEHSALYWQDFGTHCELFPVLPANFPILKALKLPNQALITQAKALGVSIELRRIEQALKQGIQMLVVRDRDLPALDRLAFAKAVRQLAEHHAAFVFLSEDGSGLGIEIARVIRADGIHLTTGALQKNTGSIPLRAFPYIGASCHNAEDMALAKMLMLDYVFLGAVLPTPSHPGKPGMGWEAFSRLIAETPCPVFALGGQGAETLRTAQSCGAHGIACMRVPPFVAAG